MSTIGFASASSTVSLSTASQSLGPKIVQAYDPSLKFNREISQKDDDPTSIIHSIDAKAILQKIASDSWDDLHKITLAGKQARDGIGIWDVLFNAPTRLSMTACILFVQNDYSPIPQDRTMVTSKFLNFSMTVSRVHLNKVVEGDRFGIGISDLISGFDYVLLYEVQEICSIPSKAHGDGDRPGMIPAVNAILHHALRLGRDGPAEVITMDENYPYEVDRATPFVEWVSDAVYDPTQAYSWKPHFLPYRSRGFDRATLEERLLTELPVATSVGYSQFEQMCRDAYQLAKNRRDVARRPQPSKPNKRRQRSDEDRPIIEVVTQGDTFTAHIDYLGARKNQIVKFTRDDLGKRSLVESFLLNDDLKGTDLQDNSSILILPPDKFGENAHVRYFTVNF